MTTNSTRPGTRTSTRLRVLGAATAALLVVGLSATLAGAAPAQAQLVAPDPPAAQTTLCDASVLSETRIEGDLVVTASCSLWRTVITGDLTVSAGAAASLSQVTVKGDVHLDPGSRASMRWSTVWGGIRGDAAGYVTLDDVTVVKSIRGSFRGVSLWRSHVRGAIHTDLKAATVDDGLGLNDTRVDGWVGTHGGRVDLRRATLTKGLTASASTWVTICGTAVTADVTVRWAHGPVEIGENVHGYPICRDPEGGHPLPNSFAGTATVVDNPHSIKIARTHVAENLVCTGNTGPRGIDTTGATVAGTRSGQCA